MKHPNKMTTGQLRKHIEDSLILNDVKPTDSKILKKAEVMWAKGEIHLSQLDQLEKNFDHQILRL